MSDAPAPSECHVLGTPKAIPLPPLEFVQKLRSTRKRKHLSGSELEEKHGGLIRKITFGLSHGKPARLADRPERKFLRVVSWNIERGKQLEGIAAYLKNTPALQDMDVLLLNEVDVGMARSGNRDVAREIAETLGFEWVFGNSYLCLSPGNPRDGEPDEENRIGFHGNAILSRYPLLRAENFSVAITKDKFQSSEKRLGHKKALWAEVETPLGKVALAAAHLDSGGSTRQRAAQMKDVLAKLEERGVAERSLIGGDFNTMTYDLKSIPRLLWNIFSKLLRGGFPHAIHHYVHPYKLYEKPIFDELVRHGFSYEPFNVPGVGTSRYEVGTFDSESKVRDYLPEIAVKILAWKLKPWNGVAPIKIDWFAGRGVKPLAPATLEKPRWNGKLLSDHDPIVVDVVW
ncbi:MAG: endonuclease/exonuclease/phosphatase family protein [Bdellovibrionota bacterium]